MAVLASTVVAATALVSTTQTASAADTTVASDGFDRTGSSSWGQAPTGGAWTVVGGTTRSTGSSTGTVAGIAGGRSFFGYLPAVSASDVNVRAAFVVPGTTEFYYGAVARRQSNGVAYQGRARIDASRTLHADVVRSVNGSVSVLGQKTLATKVSPGQTVTVETLVTGTNPVSVKSKVYVSGGPVPDWQVAKTDSSSSRVSAAGSVGMYAYNNTGQATTSVATKGFSAVSTSGAATPPVTPPVIPPATPTTPPVATGSHGSAAVGSTTYAVPSGAVFVSRSGSDAAAGTQSAPVATVTKAISKVKAGGTVVVRGGTYHEFFIVPPGKNITVQSYPNEAVWFDGSSTVSDFTQSGNTWKVDNWTTQFDASPTYSKGAPDGTATGWQFVNPSAPMAAHPDGVWINGVEQAQVGSLSQVTAGTFFADYSGKRLYLGTNPSGSTVQASTLAQAVSLRAPGTTLRGLGFRRYADSVWMQGTITTYYKNMHLENVVVADSATAGVGIFETGSTLKNVTISGSGQLGLQVSYADGLVADNVSILNSNDQKFNPAPSAGGFKVTTTRGITMKNSEIRNTTGNQFWADQSSYDINLINNVVQNGSRWGIILEISSTGVIAGNLITGNARDGICISDTDSINIWNNTVLANGEGAIAMVQDGRRITQLNVSGHDKRRAQPDMSMPWITRNIVIGNNITSVAGVTALLSAQTWDHTFSGGDMVRSSNGNVFSQRAAGVPANAFTWGRKDNWALNLGTLAAFQAASGRDANSMSIITASPVDSAYRPIAAVSSRTSSVAQPIPASIASKLGVAAGTKQLGAVN